MLDFEAYYMSDCNCMLICERLDQKDLHIRWIFPSNYVMVTAGFLSQMSCFAKHLFSPKRTFLELPLPYLPPTHPLSPAQPPPSPTPNHPPCSTLGPKLNCNDPFLLPRMRLAEVCPLPSVLSSNYVQLDQYALQMCVVETRKQAQLTVGYDSPSLQGCLFQVCL